MDGENGIMDPQELICRISGALKVGHFFMRPLPRTYRDGCITDDLSVDLTD